MIIRPLQSGEGERAAALAAAAAGAACWPPAEYERLAADPSPPGAYCLVAEEPPGSLAGLLAATVVAGEAELQNLAVVAEHRRRGVAGALLAAALQRAAACGARTTWLEVRESNDAAVAFYERHGFRQVGRRPRYYQSPAEDALIFSREIRC